MTAVVVRVWVLGEKSGEWIDPGARTDAGLATVQTSAVYVRAAGAKMLGVYAIASKLAVVLGCCKECVLTPGLTDLFEPLVVGGAATHSVKVLWNERMVVAR